MGVKSLAAHQKSFNDILIFFETVFISKNLGYKILDLLKRIVFILSVFL